ncbi:MAG: hypothetical protein E3J60_04650 [Dehalococcoidia bacterium]|nr:MAG: hypothetical protein E3J60_04650 [Dehalococcoidia bacterium]
MAKIRASGFNQGDLYDYLNNLRTRPLGNPTLAKNSSHFDIDNSTAYDFVIAGVLYTDAVNGVCDTGTAQHMTSGLFNVVLISVATTGALTGTWPSGTTGYVSEAEAIAHLPAIPSGECAIGYVTIQAGAATWTAGTDALYGGTGGTVAAATTYYNLMGVNNLDLI